MRYNADYYEALTLADGSACSVRCVRPEDREVFRRGMEQYSSDSLYWRFMSVKRELTESELDYLTQVDGIDHFALVAGMTTDHGRTGMAVARFVRVPGTDGEADFAVFVGDPYQGKGLGKVMLVRLVEAARERAVKVLVAEMFAENARMFRLVGSLGLPVEWRLEGAVTSCRITV